MLPNRLHEADLAQERNENRDPAERGPGTSHLAQDQPLIRQHGGDLARDWSIAFDPIPLLSQTFADHPTPNFGFPD
jgi:hypothetical protein